MCMLYLTAGWGGCISISWHTHVVSLAAEKLDEARGRRSVVPLTEEARTLKVKPDGLRLENGAPRSGDTVSILPSWRMHTVFVWRI